MHSAVSQVMTEIQARHSQGTSDLTHVDRQISAALEAVPDMLSTCGPKAIEDSFRQARTALEDLDVDDEPPSADFIAGRLSALVDLLGYAASQTADPAAIAFAKTAPYKGILARLREAPLRNIDLGRSLGRDKAQVSRWLAALREAGLVTSQRRGREIYNQLTPLGRLAGPAPKKIKVKS